MHFPILSDGAEIAAALDKCLVGAGRPRSSSWDCSHLWYWDTGMKRISAAGQHGSNSSLAHGPHSSLPGEASPAVWLQWGRQKPGSVIGTKPWKTGKRGGKQGSFLTGPLFGALPSSLAAFPWGRGELRAKATSQLHPQPSAERCCGQLQPGGCSMSLPLPEHRL